MDAVVNRIVSWLPPLLPRCVIELIKQALNSLLHISAISFGLVFQFNSIWDVVVNKVPFSPAGYGAGAAAVIGAWGTLWQVNRWMKRKPADAPAEGQG